MAKQDQIKLFQNEHNFSENWFFSCDQENPLLAGFINKYKTDLSTDSKLHQNSDYTNSIMSTKETSIYKMHSYWSKKPHGAIASYINHFSKEGDVILDPFSGSGGTSFVSVLSNRKGISIDLSPSASFISAFHITPCNIDEYRKSWKKVYDIASKELAFLYNYKSSTGLYYWINDLVWSEPVQCVKCLKYFHLTLIDNSPVDCCPYCDEPFNSRKRNIVFAKPQPYWVDVAHKEYSRTKSILLDEIPDVSNYIQSTISKSLEMTPRDWLNNCAIPDELMAGRLGTTGVKTAEDLFSPRCSYALYKLKKIITEVIPDKEMQSRIDFVVSSFLLLATTMRRLTTHGPSGPAGAYYVPPVRSEINILRIFKKKAEQYEDCLNEINSGYVIGGRGIVSCQSSSDLSKLPTNSIDYIFTDPPYADKMPYGALNVLWEAFHGFNRGWRNAEVRGLNWSESMRPILKECYRVLKPGKWISVCYHDTSEGTWSSLIDIMAEVGFITGDFKGVLAIDTGSRSFQQTNADKVVKRDLVINFRKPLIGEVTFADKITDDDSEITFNEKAINIIRYFLTDNPGITKDRIYDELVSHMIRTGSMEAHNFDDLLNQVAEPTINTDGHRWYLKSSALEVVDAAESEKEDQAAEKVSAFITDSLSRDLSAEGVHYSDIFENYVCLVKDKPRRHLAEWLLDYFYKTDEGTYRLPNTEEEKRLKAEGRSKGTQRSIKRYIAFLQQGVAIPEKERPNDSTLAEWIRHCKRSGLFEQGKLLYEKGGLNVDHLAEEAMVNAEEDYQVCVRMLVRGGGVATEAKPKRGRKSKA